MGYKWLGVATSSGKVTTTVLFSSRKVLLGVATSSGKVTTEIGKNAKKGVKL